jgi:AraC-like DNA-binding protein
MGWISKVFVLKALEAAVSLGCIDVKMRERLSRQFEMDASSPPDPGDMVSDTAFFDLLEHLNALNDAGRSVPVHIGASMRCDDYGAFGLAFKSAPDLLGSYARVERFGKVVTSVANFRVVESEASVFMEVIQGLETRLGLTMTNELALSAALALSREVNVLDVSPVAIHLMSGAPRDDRAYKDHFRCPILFGAARDAIEITAGTARQPNRLSDTGMATFFDAHLSQELSYLNDTSELERRIRTLVSDVLSEGVPSLAVTATRLGMSSRTLQRRLSAEGLAYQDLVVEARKSLAAQLLKRTDYALAEIAFLTGFADQSTFTRAFKRWHGRTPADYRRNQ